MSHVEEIKEEFGKFFVFQNDSLWKQKTELEMEGKSVRPSIKVALSKSHNCPSKSLPATLLTTDTRSGPPSSHHGFRLMHMLYSMHTPCTFYPGLLHSRFTQVSPTFRCSLSDKTLGKHQTWSLPLQRL